MTTPAGDPDTSCRYAWCAEKHHDPDSPIEEHASEILPPIIATADREALEQAFLSNDAPPRIEAQLVWCEADDSEPAPCVRLEAITAGLDEGFVTLRLTPVEARLLAKRLTGLVTLLDTSAPCAVSEMVA